VRAGAGSAWVETRYEDSVTLSPTGRIAADPVWQLDAGVSVALDALPGFAWAPGGLELSSQWQNVTQADRIDSLGFPLPGRVWYLRLRSRTSFAREAR
jgi:hypothetical protein